MNTTDIKEKRYKIDIADLVNYYVGEYVDIVDYYFKNNRFTIVYSEDGETEEKYSRTVKQIEKDLNVKDLIFKYNKQYPDALDRISFKHIED